MGSSTLFSVACNADSGNLVVLQTVDSVIRIQKHRLNTDIFPMFSGGWIWQEFCRDLNPCWCE